MQANLRGLTIGVLGAQLLVDRGPDVVERPLDHQLVTYISETGLSVVTTNMTVIADSVTTGDPKGNPVLFLCCDTPRNPEKPDHSPSGEASVSSRVCAPV